MEKEPDFDLENKGKKELEWEEKCEDRKSECCNAEIIGVTEYSAEEPWGVIGGHYECIKCGKEVDFNGRDVEKLT